MRKDISLFDITNSIFLHYSKMAQYHCLLLLPLGKDYLVL